tara:strand:+ start:20 stop:343 length:324 start_codon:yes stop_codon:yes gene_type:complete
MDGLHYKTFNADLTNYVLRGTTMSGGNIKQILIVNNATTGNPCVFSLFLYDTVSPNPTHKILHTRIPYQANLLLNDGLMLAYNSQRYELRLTTTVAGGTTNIDVTIK